MAALSGMHLLTSLLVADGGAEQYLSMGLHEKLFSGPESDLFKKIDTHLREYGTLPQPGTVGCEVPDGLESPLYYLADVRKRYKHRTITRALKDCQSFLVDKNPDSAERRLRECLLEVMREASPNQVVDYAKDGSKLLNDEYLSLTKGHLTPGVMTGYPTLDGLLNGLRGGDVMSIVGRPGEGKTYQLLRMAHHAWDTQHKKVLFVSMEMKPLPLIQRITAMHEKMSITLLRKGEIMKEKHAKIMANMHELTSTHEKFWIVDGNLTSRVEDTIILAKQMKPDILFVDGAYLLRVEDKRVPRFERINQTIEAIKSEISTALGIPAALTYQFGRGGVKEKELEQIGGSDSIGQISSCVLALFETEKSSVESIVRKKVNIIKGRNGEQGEFWINWIFDAPPFMDFSEITPEIDEKEFAYV